MLIKRLLNGIHATEKHIKCVTFVYIFSRQHAEEAHHGTVNIKIVHNKWNPCYRETL